MGLDASVKSIIQEDKNDPYFDSESYECQERDARLLNDIAKELGADIDFAEKAGIYIVDYRIGSYSALHILRRFAAKQDGWDGDRYKAAHGYKSYESMDGLYDDDYYLGRSKFPHLIDHSDCEGYYLPIDFEKPFFHKELSSVGSSVRLKAELETLKPDIDSKGGDYEKKLWDKMYSLACESVKHRLPIVFY